MFIVYKNEFSEFKEMLYDKKYIDAWNYLENFLHF
jgi:hypothetical protein